MKKIKSLIFSNLRKMGSVGTGLCTVRGFMPVFLAALTVCYYSSYALQQSTASTKSKLKFYKTLAMNTQNDTTMSCKLTTPELQQRKETAIKQLKDNFTKKVELENGYSYVFNGKDETLEMLTEFIKTERQCCDFFNFNIAVNNNGSITLSITGNKGAKEFIAGELEL